MLTNVSGSSASRPRYSGKHDESCAFMQLLLAYLQSVKEGPFSCLNARRHSGLRASGVKPGLLGGGELSTGSGATLVNPAWGWTQPGLFFALFGQENWGIRAIFFDRSLILKVFFSNVAISGKGPCLVTRTLAALSPSSVGFAPTPAIG